MTDPRIRSSSSLNQLSDLPAVSSSVIDTMLAGDVIAGRFRLIRMLGRGGYGAVYEAEQISMGRTVALKVLLRDIDNDPNVVERFNLEARQTSRLRHHNTVIIHDFGTDTERGVLFLAMEYLEGRDLKALLKERQRIALDDCLHVLEQVAASLQEAHELGIIHRDLKPANIMLTHRGDDDLHVKVIDFGIAKAIAGTRDDARRLTETGVLLGTPYYMAPEQLRTGDIDVRVDIYACAVMAYQMLTGRVPFDGANPIEVLSKHALEAPPSLFAAAPDLRVPPTVDAWLQRSLSKDPDARPQSMREFIAGLRRAVVVDDDMTLKAPSRDLMPAIRVGQAPLATHARATEAALEPTDPRRRSNPDAVGIPTSASPAVGGDARPPWLMPALIGGGVLAVAIIAVLLVAAMGGDGDDDNDAEASPPPTAQGDQAQPDELASDEATPSLPAPGESVAEPPTDAADQDETATDIEATDETGTGTTDTAEATPPPTSAETETAPAPDDDDREARPPAQDESGGTDTAAAGDEAPSKDARTGRETKDDEKDDDDDRESSRHSSSRSSGGKVECTLIARPWGKIHHDGKPLPQSDVTARLDARRGDSFQVELVQDGVVVKKKRVSVPRDGDCKVTVRAD